MVNELRALYRVRRVSSRERRVEAHLELEFERDQENRAHVALYHRRGRIQCGIHANEDQQLLQEDGRVVEEAQASEQESPLCEGVREYRGQGHV